MCVGKFIVIRTTVVYINKSRQQKKKAESKVTHYILIDVIHSRY